MKKTILATAGIAAATLIGVGAANAASGYIGGNYISGTQDADGIDAWAGDGAVAFDGGGSLGFQLGGDFRQVDFGGTDITFYDVSGHVYSRSDKLLWGGFASYSDSGDFDINQWNVGGEAQFYNANSTVTFAASYGNMDFGGVVDADVASLSGDVRFFPNDNLSIGGGLQYSDVQDAGIDGTKWNVGAEYQLSGAPISILAGYQNTDFLGGDLAYWRVGARFNFGGQTLKDRSQKGAGLGGTSSVWGTAFSGG